ncbi:hypothetical protein HDU67_003991 [Dinochytrium kinnereticum]|nr:hypothetical protein HDU67_003991 [Dinochytrium kinnereticum]
MAFSNSTDLDGPPSSSPIKSSQSNLDPSVSDGFLVIAKGLGIRSVLTSFLNIHLDKRNLVFLINTPTKELEALKEDIVAAAVALGREQDGSDVMVDPECFHIINNETLAPERSSIYVGGGLVAATSRILVVDMLNGTVPMHLVTGILVNHAHKVSESSTEAFILRLLRDSNKAAFIKAFSDSPELLTSGIWKLEKTMKILFLRKVYFWPRFHMTVAEVIDSAGQIDLAEVRVPMTDKMRKIQSAIIQCIDASLAELKRSNRTIDPDDLTVENALFKSFDVILKSQLDPFWHKIGSKTKQVIGDLATLRRLLTYVASYDCVTFYSFLDTIRAANAPNAASALRPDFTQSPWLLLDAADTIFSQAKARVFKKREETELGLDADRLDWLPPTLMPVLEEQPKWKVLLDVLREIEMERRALVESGLNARRNHPAAGGRRRQRPSPAVDTSIEPEVEGANRMRFTSDGSKSLLHRLLFNFLRWKGRMPKPNRNLQKNNNVPAGVGRGQLPPKNYKMERGRGGSTSHIRRRARGGCVPKSEALADSSISVTYEDEAAVLEDFLNNEMNKAEREDGDRLDFAYSSKLFGVKPTNFDAPINESEFEETFEIIDQPCVVIRPYATSSLIADNGSSISGEDDSRVLEMLKPRWIIMYDPDVSFVRRIEVYKAMQPDISLKVYFMVYDNSIEEQRYLSFIRKEKSSFEKLIKEKATMAIPIDQDGRVDLDPEEQFWRNLDTRVAGGQRIPASESRIVIVDVREFRSALPSILHSRRLTLRPCTLEVGDYILSPSMCVERKSLPDLISSLRTGRLYNQVEAMCLHYKTPLLLIEFAQGKAFSLGVDGMGGGSSSGTDGNEVGNKLSILALAFPKLRIIWSSSPAATAEIFEDLKKDQPEPDVETAMSIGVDSQTTSESVWSITPSDMIRSLPGVSSKNYRYVMSQVPTMRALGDASVAELERILGTEAAASLHAFIHRDPRL